MVMKSKSYHRGWFNVSFILLSLVFVGVLGLADLCATKVEVLSGWMSGAYIWNIIHIIFAIAVAAGFLTLLSTTGISEWLERLDRACEYTLQTEFTEDGVKFIMPRKKLQLAYQDIQDVMTWPIHCGRGNVNPISYALIIRTKGRRYRVYSEMLDQMEFHTFQETELYQVYWELKSRGIHCG